MSNKQKKKHKTFKLKTASYSDGLKNQFGAKNLSNLECPLIVCPLFSKLFMRV